MTDGTGKTVLITGTSGGIGRELAFVFAEHHFRIAATARSEEKLQELKQELENSCGVEVKAVQKDLTDKDAPHELYEEIQMAGICIDQLVNNAGVGKKDRLVDADPKTLEDLIQLNVTAPTLPRYFGQEMARRRQSRIVNVSSMDGFIPDPTSTSMVRPRPTISSSQRPCTASSKAPASRSLPWPHEDRLGKERRQG